MYSHVSQVTPKIGRNKMLNINKLRELYTADKNAKTVLDLLAKTKENTPTTVVSNICKYTRLDRHDVVTVLRKFEDLGLGVFKAGRSRAASRDRRGVLNKGYHTESRFNWTFRKSEAAMAARGVTDIVEPLLDDTEALPEDLGYLPEAVLAPARLPERVMSEKVKIVDIGQDKNTTGAVLKIVDYGVDITHHVLLRRDLEVTIKLPETLTKAELDKLIKYLTVMVDTTDLPR